MSRSSGVTITGLPLANVSQDTKSYNNGCSCAQGDVLVAEKNRVTHTACLAHVHGKAYRTLPKSALNTVRVIRILDDTRPLRSTPGAGRSSRTSSSFGRRCASSPHKSGRCSSSSPGDGKLNKWYCETTTKRFVASRQLCVKRYFGTSHVDLFLRTPHDANSSTRNLVLVA